MSLADRLLQISLLILVACLPFEFQAGPLSILQWLFVFFFAAALPVMFRERRKLLADRRVLAALVFVVVQWIAAAFAPEFSSNALKGAIRCTAGLSLLCAVIAMREKSSAFRVWTAAAVAASVYAFFDYLGFGFPHLFRSQEFFVGAAMRLSGSFEYPNTAAAYFAMSLPIVWLTLKRNWSRFAGALTVWTALLMTYSRGGVLAALVVIGIWAFRDRARPRVFTAALAGLTFLALLVVHPLMLTRVARSPLPDSVSAEYFPEFTRLAISPQSSDDVLVTIRNTGSTPWNSTEAMPPTIASRWYDLSTRNLVPGSEVKTPIPASVQSGASVNVRVIIRSPQNEGRYLLTFDIFDPGSGWLSGEGVYPGMAEAEVRRGTTERGIADLSQWRRREIAEMYVANVPFTRAELWRAAAWMIARRPILGFGADLSSTVGSEAWNSRDLKSRPH